MEKTSKRSKKIRKGDKVIVIAGNDAGVTGTVLSCSAERATVQGVNVRKKHVRPTQQNQKGGIVELEKPVHISNLRVCTKDDKPVKLKVRTDKKGAKDLVYRIDGKEVVHRSLKKS